jgi:hypothetical protein
MSRVCKTIYRREGTCVKFGGAETWAGRKLLLYRLLVLLDNNILIFSQPDSLPKKKILVGQKQARKCRQDQKIEKYEFAGMHHSQDVVENLDERIDIRLAGLLPN